ncbi:cofactor-independent phosphoglycerate mutase [Deferribacter autotrophicus]|uniref:Cofactor-independent phosphoglycerate mutase n=1 Tax=Deferribacter autotrophicus TaxID=500465 RepID=A0A5A8F6D1_9BACT|nr:cofactor-independent phosphoglycerate mutase [Deferribacter autotrophicus]KAA0257443.1 cofactor-independent phosphoglycerate mutase [Deferribacter autotrophicus]
MKYIVLLCDGMSDHKIDKLDNKTVLEYTRAANFDKIAKEGRCGFIHTTPKGWYPGSDVCNLSIFGYNPVEVYTGRSPIEAASIGIDLGEKDFAFRCNLVTLDEKREIMEDFSAYHVDKDTAKKVIDYLNEQFKGYNVEFYPGVGYRNIMVVRDYEFEVKTTPPHDIMGQPIDKYLPKGKNAEILNELIKKSWQLLDNKFGKVNSIWLWGEGKKPKLTSFEEKFGVKGAVVAAVDLVRGIGKLADMELIDVPGATGFIDTNFEGKAEYAVNALNDYDYVYIHVEAPDEAGHMGSVEEKIKAVQNINDKMLPIIIEGLKKFDEYRLLITPDHPTPVEVRTHVPEPVPAIIWGSDIEPDLNEFYDENINPSFEVKDGYKIAELFIRRSK